LEFGLSHGLWAAAVEHGPGMHGGLLGILIAVAIVAGLVYLVKGRR
jgi:hypothetical protein